MVGRARKSWDNVCPRSKEYVRRGKLIKIKNVVDVGSVDGFPDGWSKEIWTKDIGGKIRQYPFYKNSASGLLFYSKRDALRFIQTGDCSLCKIKPRKIEEPNIESTDSNAIDIGSDGLPDELSKEIRSKDIPGKLKNGSNYKDPEGGLLFHSEKDEFRFVETGDSSESNAKPKKIEQTGLESTEALSLLEKIDEYLKKIDVLEHYSSGKSQNRIFGEEVTKLYKDTEAVKSDYVDPISGYMFLSKPDSLRYIATGDIRKCSWKPMKIESVDDEPTRTVIRKEMKKEKLEVLTSLDQEQMDLSRRLCH